MSTPEDPCEIVMPDLDLADVNLRAGAWLARLGGPVIEGDRLLEVIAGDVTVDLPAPVSGELMEKRARENEQLVVGHFVLDRRRRRGIQKARPQGRRARLCCSSHLLAQT